MVSPTPPTAGFLQTFMTPSLLAAKPYHIDIVEAPIKLDQNESPWDWLSASSYIPSVSKVTVLSITAIDINNRFIP